MCTTSEDMIDGTVCNYCGCFFQDPDDDKKAFTHGYPVICKGCYRKGVRLDGIQKATTNAIQF